MVNGMAKRPPDLHHAVKVLETLSRDTPNKTPKAVGEIYVASLALLYHLKLDQATIRTIRQQHEDAQHIPFPKPKSIPAMMNVIHNQNLLRALVSCLSCSTEDPATLSNKSNLQTLPSRKRAHSFEGDTPSDNGTANSNNKLMKVTHSPHISKRRTSIVNNNLNGNQTTTKPEMNVRVLAATILFVSFEYLDHWPVPLVQAYADDCFGPRLWVDLPSSQLLAKNLELAHREDSSTFHETLDNDEEWSTNALLVADFYNHLVQNGITKGVQSGKVSLLLSSPSKQLRRGSHSSHASHTSSLSVPSSGRRRRSMSSESLDNPNLIPVSSVPRNTTATANSNDGEESDSGDEEVAITPALSKESVIAKNNDGSSSSSGEEDGEEVVVASTRSFDEDSMHPEPRHSPTASSTCSVAMDPNALKITYPVTQQHLVFTRIRQRYFGVNLEYAHAAIAQSLQDRLDVKSKQNSGLLQALPSFTSIAPVRRLITSNLEKWLQSPALAGLARNLFSTTVKMMKDIDPPLPDDLEAIDNILAMRLKANQLNAHVENVTAIASNLPATAVADHIYSSLLRQVLLVMDSTSDAGSDQLKMIRAVHNVLPKKLSADGMAAALLSLLFRRSDHPNMMTSSHSVKQVRALMRAIAKELGASFDAFQLLSSIISRKIPLESWTAEDVENKARLIFQCATHVARKRGSFRKAQPNASNGATDEEKSQALKQRLVEARRLILRWCCRHYAPTYKESPATKPNGNKEKKESTDEIVGAGPADFSSILDGQDGTEFPAWLNVMRSILFLEDSDSPRLKHFLAPDGSAVENDSEWDDEANRINQCCSQGADLDDEMVWTILKSATMKKGGMPQKMALPLLEHLFESCKKENKARLHIRDPNILWELYKLVEYVPYRGRELKKENEDGDVEMKDAESGAPKSEAGKVNEDKDSEESDSQFPQLAYPGMWWRVTGLALIICGMAPNEVGSVAWKEHPTLRALMKMVTSDRYRFPTADCDPTARDEMLKTEQAMRGEEAKVTELLFNSKKSPKKKKKKVAIEPPRGSRMSKRQKEKREQQLKKQREKEAAQAAAETNRRKKMLRAAQKSIMLWDPKKGARKPPKESVDMILSVSEFFDLPRSFQQNTEPDFLLMTIGNTTRGAIERAYDWLIPIISFIPNAISRLPASASCFLLLRAYGTEGEERAQLQELSTPLLLHVRDSLTGNFGEADAIRAFDLLLADASSQNADRRRCARRVLNDALGKEETISFDNNASFQKTNFVWMIKVLHVQHATSVMSDAIKYIYRAASFERGKTLRFHVLALEQLTEFAKEKGIPGNWDFPSMLINLISKRPTILAETMSSFPDLRSTAIRIVHDEFSAYVAKSPRNGELKEEAMVEINLYCGAVMPDDSNCRAVEATLPLSLLESSCVLLSIWLDDDKEGSEKGSENQKARDLVRMLMRPHETGASEASVVDDSVGGLASTRIAGSGKSAVPVESWVMLARSRSDFVAKRAALTAPTGFLTRLLLCSGLPRASLLTMIDRLGRVGDEAEDKGKTFNQLLVSSATSEWDIGRLGHRREVSRKLLGRLCAYSRIYELSKLQEDECVSFTFLDWLSESCKSSDQQRKSKLKKPKQSPPASFASIESINSIFGNLPDDIAAATKSQGTQLGGDASDMAEFRIFGVDNVTPYPQTLGDSDVKEFLDRAFERNESHRLGTWLDTNFGHYCLQEGNKKRKSEDALVPKIKPEELAFCLLNAFVLLDRKTEPLGSCILKWVPKLSVSKGSARFWKVLLLEGQHPYSMWKNLVSRCTECWSHSHVSQCRDWILTEGKNEELDHDNTVRFIIHSSAMSAIHVTTFSDVAIAQEDTAWGRSEESVRSVSKLALDCLLKSNDELMEQRLRSRNEPPECLILLLLIARLGKKQVQCVSQAIVERIKDADERGKNMLRAVILRMYAYFPNSMNLGVTMLRTVLKSAAESHATHWLSWRSPMDDQLQDMFDSVISNRAPPHLVQALSEGAKKHPLLLLRKIPFIDQALSADAIACDRTAASETRGILFGQNPNGPLTAKMDGRLVTLTAKHWGFNFTENIWTACLDIVSSIPTEVLFGCGLKLGMIDFLGVYLRLIFIHSQLRTCDRFTMLKAKFGELLKLFENSNKQGWEAWLNVEISGLSSLGGARNVLMSCDYISHQQAIDSVKKRQDATSSHRPSPPEALAKN